MQYSDVVNRKSAVERSFSPFYSFLFLIESAKPVFFLILLPNLNHEVLYAIEIESVFHIFTAKREIMDLLCFCVL